MVLAAGTAELVSIMAVRANCSPGAPDGEGAIIAWMRSVPLDSWDPVSGENSTCSD